MESNSLASVEIKPLTAEEAQEVYVGVIDAMAAEEKGLAANGTPTERYCQAAAAYLATLNYWLCHEHNLNMYQDAFVGQSVTFSSDDACSAVKKNGAFGRGNIYIRNGAHVERLSTTELNMLLENMKGSDLTISQPLLDMVKANWRDILSVRMADAPESFDVIYSNGALSGMQSAPNNALVLQISYDIMLDDSDSLREELVFMLRDLMESDLSSSLDAEVSVIVERM